MLNIQTKEQILSAYKKIQLTGEKSRQQKRRIKRLATPNTIKLNDNNENEKQAEPIQTNEELHPSQFIQNRRTRTQEGTARVKKYISLYGKISKSPHSVEGKRQSSLNKSKKLFIKQPEVNNSNINDIQYSENSKSTKYLSYHSKLGCNSSTPSSRPISSVANGGRVMTASSLSSNPHQRELSTTTETQDLIFFNQKQSLEIDQQNIAIVRKRSEKLEILRDLTKIEHIYRQKNSFRARLAFLQFEAQNIYQQFKPVSQFLVLEKNMQQEVEGQCKSLMGNRVGRIKKISKFQTQSLPMDETQNLQQQGFDLVLKAAYNISGL